MEGHQKLKRFSLKQGEEADYILGSHLGKVLGFERGVLYTKHPELALKYLTSEEKEHASKQGVTTYRFPTVVAVHVDEALALLKNKYPKVNIEITNDNVPPPPPYRAAKKRDRNTKKTQAHSDSETDVVSKSKRTVSSTPPSPLPVSLPSPPTNLTSTPTIPTTTSSKKRRKKKDSSASSNTSPSQHDIVVSFEQTATFQPPFSTSISPNPPFLPASTSDRNNEEKSTLPSIGSILPQVDSSINSLNSIKSPLLSQSPILNSISSPSSTTLPSILNLNLNVSQNFKTNSSKPNTRTNSNAKMNWSLEDVHLSNSCNHTNCNFTFGTKEGLKAHKLMYHHESV